MSSYRRPPAPVPGPASGTEERRPGWVRVVRAPFVLAARIHRPTRPDRIVDDAIRLAQIARTAIGLLAGLWLVLAYPLREGAGGVVDDKFTEVLVSAGLLLVIGPLGLAAFVFSARPPGPVFYRGRLRGPATAIGSLFATVLVMSFGLPYASMIGPLGALAGLFLFPFALASAVLCVHHAFRTADVHEVLPPLLSPVLVWCLFLVQLFDDAPVDAPLAVRVLFLVAPPLSVTALSVWELRRLRTSYGITLRRALGRDNG
ncbi:hypothetical protein BCL76_114164 [Streptomyces sp. CG 926]|uniref:hypothetical protein n=1 Tax=Streptomyces sp. CG 926 TaxID=1882405 RepID=UPI000D7B1FC6|nr:hypothetical protein [Streptomyces sp. CG 926]PWK64842.1 hypothetical protein BCL76_114164 [Streptomyces sp. CG 926]